MLEVAWYRSQSINERPKEPVRKIKNVGMRVQKIKNAGMWVHVRGAAAVTEWSAGER